MNKTPFQQKSMDKIATSNSDAGSLHNEHRRAMSCLPDPEVPEKKPRRRFTAKYKLRILEKADACTAPGQLGALLRCEGLYSSNLATWRQQRDQGLLAAMTPKKRGRKAKEKNPLTGQIAKLERENWRLQQKLKKAEIIIEAQKKISEILGIDQNLSDEERNE